MPDSNTQSMGCLDLHVLELIAAERQTLVEARVVEHIRACNRCADLLAEMKSANRFLSRFKSTDEHQTSRDSVSGLISVRGYEVLGLIGFGGQGQVYKAVQRSTGRHVAIKVPLGSSQQKPSTRYRFEREVELLARLDHPGIVKVYGACDLEDGRVGCVMEFVQGVQIDQWAADKRSSGRDGLCSLVRVMEQVADAIAFAHQKAVLHRDIKPSNVMIDTRGQPRVLDFGLAKSLDGSGGSFVTNTGAFLGTLVYASPEQIELGGAGVDLYTDVYALGLLLYQVTTGTLPYSIDASANQIMRHIRETIPPRPSESNPALDAELDAITLKALAKEKHRRYSTAAEFGNDLRAWLFGEPVRARMDSRWYVFQKTIKRRKRTLLAGCAVLVGVLILGVATIEASLQANKARMATVVRDAQIVASHAVRMTEARLASADNFSYGEAMAWDALLDPEQVLVEMGIEGPAQISMPTASPAMWALWEMYQKTPIVGSIPLTNINHGLFGETTDEIITLHDDGIRFWSWSEKRQTGHHRHDERIVSLEARFGHCVVRSESGASYHLNRNKAEWTRIESINSLGFKLAKDRIAFLSSERTMVEIVDAHPTAGSAGRVTVGFQSPILYYETDVSGEVFAVHEQNGTITLLEAEHGAILYVLPGGVAPHISRLSMSGVPHTFLGWGQDGAVRIHWNRDLQEVGLEYFQSLDDAGIPLGAERILARSTTDRMLMRTARVQVGVIEFGQPVGLSRVYSNLPYAIPDLSPDGSLMCIFLRDAGRLAICDLERTQARRLLFPSVPGSRGYGTLFDIAFTSDSSTLYAGSIDGTIRAYKVGGIDRGEMIAEGIQGGVSRISLIGSGMLIGSHDLDVVNAQIAAIDHGGEVSVLAHTNQRINSIVTDDAMGWVLASSGELMLFDLASGALLRQIDISEHVAPHLPRSLAVLSEEGLILIGTYSGPVLALDSRTLTRARPLTPPIGVRRILAHPLDPRAFVTAGEDGMIRVWRLEGEPGSAVLKREFGSHAGPIFCFAFHPDGRLLATGGGAPEARDIRIWDSLTGRELAALDLFEMGVFDIAFSPDGRWLAAGGEVRVDHAEEGGQLFLVDLWGPLAAMRGNMEYHIRRYTEKHGQKPNLADEIRHQLSQLPSASDTKNIREPVRSAIGVRSAGERP